MKMKIVQFVDQSERSLSSKDVFSRFAEVLLVEAETLEDLLAVLEDKSFDLVLCSSAKWSDSLSLRLREYVPDVPVILLSSDSERGNLSRDGNPEILDIVFSSEMDRLPLSVSRAVRWSREQKRLRDELAQTRDLLLSCQKSISVGRLLGSIAHEINNPLEAITNLLYLGQRNLSDEEGTRKCLQMAEEELQRVSEITKQMLQFHRESRGEQEISLADVMESILVLYQNRLEMRSIQVVRKYQSSQRLRGHPGELRQAFSNLVANAIDAMPSGGQLVIKIRDGRACKLAVTIADRGQGIPRETISRLGELLFTTKGESGTGLGLWVTYQLLAKHGGSVKVYSSTNPHSHGTAFRVCFADPIGVLPAPDQSGSIKLGIENRLVISPRKLKLPINLPSECQRRA